MYHENTFEKVAVVSTDGSVKSAVGTRTEILTLSLFLMENTL